MKKLFFIAWLIVTALSCRASVDWNDPEKAVEEFEKQLLDFACSNEENTKAQIEQEVIKHLKSMTSQSRLKLLTTDGFTLLVHSIMSGAVPVTKELLTYPEVIKVINNVDENEKDTPLTIAHEFENSAAEKLLLSHNAIYKTERSPAEQALRKLREICREYLQNQTDLTKKNNLEQEASQLLDTKMIEKEIEKAPLSLLILFIKTESLPLVQKMLEFPAVKKALDTLDPLFTIGVLHAAAIKNKRSDIAELLFNNGAKTLDITTQIGRTPLMFAIVEINKPMVEWFLKKGADVNKKDEDSLTILDIAITYAFSVTAENSKNSLIEIIKVLLNAGAQLGALKVSDIEDPTIKKLIEEASKSNQKTGDLEALTNALAHLVPHKK